MHDDKVDHNLSNLKSNLHLLGIRSERPYMPTLSEQKHKGCKLRESHGNMYNTILQVIMAVEFREEGELLPDPELFIC